jgi:hypothetical protein
MDVEHSSTRPVHHHRTESVPHSNTMKTKILTKLITSLIVATTLLLGCETFKSYASSEAKDLALQAVQGVLNKYKTTDAGQLASAGLSAAADVMQGYVDKQPPLKVAAASPGVAGVGQKVVAYLQKKGWVTQSVVDTIHDAAAIAANVTVKPSPTPSATPSNP